MQGEVCSFKQNGQDRACGEGNTSAKNVKEVRELEMFRVEH